MSSYFECENGHLHRNFTTGDREGERRCVECDAIVAPCIGRP